MQLQDIDLVIASFYRIIFIGIGYSGKYVDYGSTGWPDRDHLTPPALLQTGSQQLTVNFRVPLGAGQPQQLAAEELDHWILRMQAAIEQQTSHEPFNAQFQTDIGVLYVQAFRDGLSFSAAWTLGAERLTVAISVFLAGVNEIYDAAAMKAFRKHPAIEKWPDEEFSAVQASIRPSVWSFYLDSKCYQSGIIDAAARGLALAILSGPGSTPYWSTSLTPDEVEKSMKRTVCVASLIFDKWIETNGPMPYLVRSSKTIKGKPAGELANVPFFVGTPDGRGEELNGNELYATFLLIAQMAEAAKHATLGKENKFEVKVLHHPATIAKFLGSINVQEPD